MSLQAGVNSSALIVTLAIALAGCGKKEEPGAAPASESSASAPLTAADCDRMPNPSPTDDSAAGRSTAVSQGVAARAACKRAASAPEANADLARMREIMEKQEAERKGQKLSNEESARRVKEAGKAPVKEYKY